MGAIYACLGFTGFLMIALIAEMLVSHARDSGAFTKFRIWWKAFRKAIYFAFISRYTAFFYKDRYENSARERRRYRGFKRQRHNAPVD